MKNVDAASGETSEGGLLLLGKFFFLFVLGFSLFAIGIIFILIAILLYGVDSPSLSAVIFIGPFPIVFGVGSDSGLMIVAGLLIALLSIILFWVVSRKVRRCSP